jgi:hypothetical protein
MSSLRINFNSTNLFQVLFQNSGLFKNFGNAQVGVGFISEDANGNGIAFYSERHGWLTEQTPAENERGRDFFCEMG